MSKGRFLEFGGQYAPETMMSALTELEDATGITALTRRFRDELLRSCAITRAVRPGSHFAEKMTRDLGGARIYLKREDFEPHGFS